MTPATLAHMKKRCLLNWCGACGCGACGCGIMLTNVAANCVLMCADWV